MVQTELFADVLGPDGAPHLVLVHGFTQTRRCWAPVADDLSRDHRLTLVDAPGHGRSADVDVDFATGAGYIGDTGGPATYIGYSMGGRYCLQLALDRPQLVDRLVLIAASPGIADDNERDERRRADQIVAERISELGLPAFIEEWLAQPIFRGLDAAHSMVCERLENTACGLQSSLIRAGTGEQPDLWPRLHELDMPVLLVTGSQDAKFSRIAEQMAEAIGQNARHMVVAGAGHAAHLEQPDAALTILRAWLRATSS